MFSLIDSINCRSLLNIMVSIWTKHGMKHFHVKFPLQNNRQYCLKNMSDMRKKVMAHFWLAAKVPF